MKFKKNLAVLLTAATVFSSVNSVSALTKTTTTQEMCKSSDYIWAYRTVYKEIYKEGSSFTNQKTYTYFDSGSFTPHKANASHCWAYVVQAIEDYYGTDCTVKNEHVSGYVPEVGDAICYTSNAATGTRHIIFVTDVNGDKIKYTDNNGRAGTDRVSWKYSMKWTDLDIVWYERPLKVGDCNADGVVDSNDSIKLYSNFHSGRLNNRKDYETMVNDINNDGNITLDDVLMFNKYISDKSGAPLELQKRFTYVSEKSF